MQSSNTGHLVVPSNPTVTFSRPVPYRVVQKQHSPVACVILVRASESADAPAVLAVKANVGFFKPTIGNPLKTLKYHDKVVVKAYQPHSSYDFQKSNNHNFVKVFRSLARNIFLDAHGIVVAATLEQPSSVWTELAFVVSTANNNVHVADPNTVQESPLPNEMCKDAETGDLMRIYYALHPAGSVLTSENDYAGHPETLNLYQPSGIILKTNLRYVVKVELISENIEEDELSQYYVASIAVLEISRREPNFHQNSIGPVKLVWNTAKPYYSQVLYCVQEGLPTGEKHALSDLPHLAFRQGSIAALKRVAPNVASAALTPIYVRITAAIYEAGRTLISFIVNADMLVATWRLSAIQDLHDGLYCINPMETFCHLRGFATKLAANKDYIQERLMDNPIKGAILRTFLPFPVSKTQNLPITQSTEHIFDSSLDKGAFTCLQYSAIESIVKGESFVVVEGGAKMGKTEMAVHAIPGILTAHILPHQNSKCLLIVSSHPSLCRLLTKVARTKAYIDLHYKENLRTLSLLDCNEGGTFTVSGLITIIKVVLYYERDYDLSNAEKNALHKAASIMSGRTNSNDKSKSKKDRYTPKCVKRSLMSPIVVPDEEYERVDASAICQDDVFTSEELAVLQEAIGIVFSHYRPNLVVFPMDLLICLMPVIGDKVTHFFVDEAGLTYALDMLAVVTEARRLEQLVIIGDRVHFPDDHYNRLKRTPKCLTSAMRCVQIEAHPVVYHLLRKTFHMHVGIALAMRYVFYPDFLVDPLDAPRGLVLENVFGDPDVPLMFLDCVGFDQPCFPATRCNAQQGLIALYTAKCIMQTNSHTRITILCYYTGQVNILRQAAEERNINVKVTTVDAFHGLTTDVAIVVTTRTLDECNNPQQYVRLFKDEKLCLQRLPTSVQQNCQDVYNFLFSPQRLLTAISRGECAVFFIGSAELLCKNPLWKKVIDLARKHNNFIEEPTMNEDLDLFTSNQLRNKAVRTVDTDSDEKSVVKRPRLNY